MKIRGNVVSTNMKRPDFHQTDERKSDFMKNNPLPILSAADEGKCLIVKGGKIVPVAEKLTPLDKEEIVQAVVERLPFAEEVSV